MLAAHTKEPHYIQLPPVCRGMAQAKEDQALTFKDNAVVHEMMGRVGNSARPVKIMPVDYWSAEIG